MPSHRRTTPGRATYVTVKGHMHQGEKLVHAVLIMLTLGLWLPFYLTRKRAIERTSTTYAIDR
jgi:hypothetical protein